MACVYTFKDAKGQEVRLEGIPALKSYLVEGGLEEMFPERELPRSVADILGPQFSVQAWHGSPYDHDKFDSAKIGTGEGEPAFGYGLYFTDRKDIAEHYRNNLSKNFVETSQGNIFAGDLFRKLIAMAGGDGAGNMGLAAQRVVVDLVENGKSYSEIADSLSNSRYAASYGKLPEAIRELAPKMGVQGKVYKVELAPNDDELLDWDKPLREQSEKVQNALAIAKGEGALPNTIRDLGLNIYIAIKHRFNSAKRASLYLHSLGIRGIKYKAEGGKSDANNYVIFSDDDISIVDKFSKKPQLYSQLREAMSSAPDRIFSTGPQTKAWLKGNAPKLGIKADEIYWSGIEDFLDAQGKVSKQNVLAYLDENGVRTEDVVLGGEPDTERSKRLWADANSALTEFGNAARKENLPLTINGKQYFDDDLIYELEDGLLSVNDLPNSLKPLADKWLSLTNVAQNDAINSSVVYKEPKHGNDQLTLPGGKDYRETVVTIPTVEKFNEQDSIHFGDVGQGKQIAWTRSNVRTDSTGKDTLFLEEVQSQRGQEGRKKGFNGLTSDQETRFNTLDNMSFDEMTMDQRIEYDKLLKQREGLTPPAPFITDQNNKATNAYISLLLKKSVLQAIENGQDSVSWTTGEQQADRYDLSKHVDAIGYYERGDAYNVTVWGKGTEDEYGPVIYKNESATRDDLEQNLGKELANKIINGEGRKDGKIKYLEDLDLKVGGEWAQAMYGDSQGLNAQGQPALITQAAREIAKRFGGKVGSVELSTGAQPALIITPEMKAKVLNEGLPLFSRIRPDQTANIFEKTEDAVAQLTSDFGVGIQSLLDNGVLILGYGKAAWPESAKSVMNGDEEAVYVGGRIYIDLQHTAKDRLKAVALHEIGEHFNLRKMLGSKAYSDLQNQIKHRAKIEGSVAQQMWNRVAREYPTLEPGSEKFVSEVIARLGEHNPNAPWYKRLLAQVKSFLLKHGLARGITAKTITENDIHELLLTSLRSAARGADPRSAIFYGGARTAFSAQPATGQPLPPATPPTAQEQSHWYNEVKDKLDKFSDNLFRDRLSLFTVEQITELAQRYMPGLSQYNDLLQARTAEQSRWMRDADQLVSEKWRKLDKRDQARLHNTIQKSTLSDIDASRAWSGIEKQESGKTGAKQPLFYVYTQTTLSGRYQKIAARIAKGLKANAISKSGAIFNDENTAKAYFDKLQRIERNQQAFQSKYASGRENAQRKKDHASVVNLFNALPEDAKYVYSKANDLHNAMFKSKLETHLENIEQAVENLEVRKQMVQEVRYNFENKKLNWYYAPLSRFGRHWLYGTTADGKKWYSTYETEQARAKAEETLKASGVTIKGKGTSLENLNNPSESGIDDKFIADITQLIAAANLAPEAQRELGDEIYQMYLSSLPDVSMRKNGMHRENVLGFSEDAMRSFSNAMHHGSSQLANMKYGRQMKRVLDDHERAKSYAEMPGRKQGALDEIEAMSELRDNWEAWSQPGELEAMIENAKLNDEEALPLYEKAMTYRNKLGRMDIEDAEDTLDNLVERAQKVIKMSELIKTDDFNKAAITLEELAKSHDFMMNTASTSMDRVATALNQVNFVMMLGFSLSGGLVNMLQTPGAAIPIVLGKHSAAKTISAFNKAFMDFMSAFRHQLKDEDGNTSITQLLPERIRQAEREGRTADVKRLNETLAMLEFRKEDGTISRTQTFDIIGVGREGSNFGSPLQSFMQKAGWMFHHAERLNREVTLVASYELARDAGKSHQEASDYAKYVTDRAHLNYTSENAARLFRGPLSRIALQFKKYTQGMMFLWGKTAADALASVSRDKFATEAEWQAAKAQKREAARTLAALFFMQTSMAGALGLPLMGVLGVVYGMLGAAVGDDDDPWNLERDLRLGLAKFIGDDAAEAATMGFINSFTPLNISSRLDMADIFFRDPNRELEGRDAATHYVSEVLGATGGTIAKTWQGVKYLADGYYMRGAEQLLPKAVSDIVKTARFAKEGARTLDDKPLRDVSADELLFQIMGFGSSAQERMYAEREYAMQKQNAIQTARSRIIHEAAKAHMNGEALPTEARLAWNKKHPEWPITMDNIRTSVRRQRQLLRERGDKGYNTNPKLESVLSEINIKE